MAAGARHPRLGADVGVAAALGEQQQPQPGARAEGRRSAARASLCASSPDGGYPQGGKLFRGLRTHPPERVDRAVGHQRHPVGVGERNTPAGFAKPVATLARCLLSLMPTEQDSPVSEATTVRICSATSAGSPARQPDVRLVPAPHLDRVSQVA